MLQKNLILDQVVKKGNYFTVAQDIVAHCGEEVKNKTGYSLNNLETDGSVDNSQLKLKI